MPTQTRIVSPGPAERTVRTERGEVLTVPEGWELLPPGDAGLTRRVKAAGPTWTVQQKRGRKVFSLGVWAPGPTIAAMRDGLAAERSTDAYTKRLAAGRQRRERQQEQYVGDFRSAVLAFLEFAPEYGELAAALATAVTEHATPVGSGTVARTERIPLERRAEAAVIAWMRHQTTGYDNFVIPRVKGQRREVRRMLAARSRQLLQAYREGGGIDPAHCPLQSALARREAELQTENEDSTDTTDSRG
jgi:hypothetical protein